MANSQHGTLHILTIISACGHEKMEACSRLGVHVMQPSHSGGQPFPQALRHLQSSTSYNAAPERLPIDFSYRGTLSRDACMHSVATPPNSFQTTRGMPTLFSARQSVQCINTDR